MASKSTIKVRDLSKCYRIGLKDEMHTNFIYAIADFLRKPLKNYRKYRSLYVFDDIKNSRVEVDSTDIIWALRDVSFEVKQGEVVGIIGRNGAGKSTLLKILSKITDPTSGCAEIHGRVSSLLEIGTGFHQELTGRENVYLNGTILGMTKKEIDRKFEEIVEFSGVRKFIETPVKRYSSGMKVRLAFSVAAHLEAEILLIDEVLAVGDKDFQKKCLGKMDDIVKEGRTILFVSHNLSAIKTLCKRTILFDEGLIIGDGPSDVIVNRYLGTGDIISAERVWPDRLKAPGGKIARLCAMRVRNGNGGEVAGVIDIRNPITIEMEYEVLTGGHVLMPYLKLYNEEGVQIFTTIENDLKWRGRARPPGLYSSKVRIPGNLLSEGSVYVHSALHTINPQMRQFSEQDVVAFTVTDNYDGDSARAHWPGRMTGVVRPLLIWDTELTANM